jgi:demethylmenaquinone methyltransferase/2-methoxy-6-polyprenyl-1,4-benzoquinol methylase
MDDELKPGMMSYYDQRAPEYDEIYLGKGPAIPDPVAYKNDLAKITQMVSAFGRGLLVDIGCGTGFWLSGYARNCSRITLIDQSEKMLSECKRRVVKLGLKEKCDFVQGDFFEVTFENCLFDGALVGFFISHLTLEQEQSFFAKLRMILKPHGELMLIDSAWSSIRQQYRKKEGLQERALNDGRTFTIYKRYFDKFDVEEMFVRHSFKLESLYLGNLFLTAMGNSLG